MPRNGSGAYSLPESPFVPGTTISSAAVNSDLSDIALALSGSVASDGQTPITGPITFSDGTFSAPGITFNSDTSTGVYRPAASQLGVTLGGTATFLLQAPSASVGAGITGINGAVLIPVGIVSPFAGSSAPTGWLLCFGQSLLRAGYPELFGVLSTTWGAADATHFNLPDLRARSVVPPDNMGGSAANRLTVNTRVGGWGGVALSGGAEFTILTAGQIPQLSGTFTSSVENQPHTHTLGGQVSGGNVGAAGSDQQNQFAGTGTTGNPSVQHTHQTTVTLGAASPSLVPIVQPTITMNYIVFAGRP